jgi:intracellular sulfur oxidation DsrE/DsrF family protein
MAQVQRTRATGIVSRRDALGTLGLGAAAVGALAESSRLAAAQEATPAAPSTFKVVLHASQESHWAYILANLRNLEESHPQAKLRVVADGTSVYTLVGENSITNELTKLAAGFEFQVCPNALQEHQIDPSTIPSFASTSIGGVVALVVANQDGFVYVKP